MRVKTVGDEYKIVCGEMIKTDRVKGTLKEVAKCSIEQTQDFPVVKSCGNIPLSFMKGALRVYLPAN
jgi:hypothetical protein